MTTPSKPSSPRRRSVTIFDEKVAGWLSIWVQMRWPIMTMSLSAAMPA